MHLCVHVCEILLLEDSNAKHTGWFADDKTNRQRALLKNLMDSFNLSTRMNSNGQPIS